MPKRLKLRMHTEQLGGRAVQIADLEGSASIWDEIRRVKFRSPTWNLFCLEGRALHSAATTNDFCEFLSNLSRINKDRKNKRCGIAEWSWRRGRHSNHLAQKTPFAQAQKSIAPTAFGESGSWLPPIVPHRYGVFVRALISEGKEVCKRSRFVI